MLKMETIEQQFNEQELFDILQSQIQIKSQNLVETEEEIAHYVVNLLMENGIKAELSWAGPGRPNVIARLYGVNPGPTIIYNGHLDTVPIGNGWTEDPFGGVIKNGKMYGRGASDMKSGVSSMIYAAIVLQRLGNPFNGELILFLNVDEERSNLGMKKFLQDQIHADYAIISEPTNLNICIGHRGAGRYLVKTKGHPGHTAYIKDPDNAIYKMTKLINAIENLGLMIKQREVPIVGNASLLVTQIKGGTAPNIVPDFCEIEMDRRTLPNETREQVLEEIEDCIREVSIEGGFDYEIENYLFLPASFIEQEHPFVQQLAEVVSNVRKVKPAIEVFGATCEAPFFSVERNIPTIILGPGSLDQAHVDDEYVELKEVVDAAKIFVQLVMKLLK